MSVTTSIITRLKNLLVIHVSGTLDIGEEIEPYAIHPRRPSAIFIYNDGNSAVDIETSPTLDGPWIKVKSIGKKKYTNIEEYSVYTRFKLDPGDQVDSWITIFRL